MRKVFERYLREEEERRLFATIRKLSGTANHEQRMAMRDYCWMRLMRYTGIRVETMAGLTVADARDALATHYLSMRPEITKGNRGGKVYCTRNARAALRTLLRVRRSQGAPDLADAPLVLSTKQKRMAIRTYQARMAHWVTAAGLEVKASPHWLRHTLAKRIMKNSTAEDPRGIVMASLNHRDFNATAIYTLPDREDIEQALEEVNG